MTKQQENRAFVKMLKEFPKAFGRVSFRERLMLRVAFTYITEEVIADIKANCDLAIEGRDVKIKEFTEQIEHLTKEVNDLENMKATLESKIADLETQIEKMKCCYNCANDTLEPPEVISNGVCENCINHSKWELQY